MPFLKVYETVMKVTLNLFVSLVIISTNNKEYAKPTKVDAIVVRSQLMLSYYF